MIDPQVAFDKLAQFETAEELREFFQYEGIQGIRADAHSCPIANYMNKTTGQEFAVFRYVHHRGVNEFSPGYFFSETTSAMFQFVKNFDNKHYPELNARLEEELYYVHPNA